MEEDQNRVEKILLKPQVKSIVLAVFTLLISIAISLLGTWNINEIEYFPVKVAALFSVIVLYIVCLLFYATAEVNTRRIIEEREKQINALQSFAVDMINICKANASGVNECIHVLENTGKLEPALWNFDKACQEICNYAYNIACILGGNQDFGVAYVRLVEDTKPEREIFMNSYANEQMRRPSIYKIKRRIDKEDVQNYHDVDLFRRNKSDIDIIIGSDKIDREFSYSSKSSRNKNKEKYNLYVGIPVFCNDEKMIGLLEIVGKNRAHLGSTEEEVREIINKFFMPYAYTFLLLHKLEKSLITNR